jgi:hypothetical protein
MDLTPEELTTLRRLLRRYKAFLGTNLEEWILITKILTPPAD